jgi:site-specific DNA-methyltransferase (adenine-specific)
MLRVGDCLDLMPTLDAGSVDAIVTDPPYGLAFMGKQWDHGVPGVPFWAAALRVAKPGAHLVAFGGTRTYHRLTCAIEDAGWEIRDCLSWLYGSGFPKSHNGPWGGTALKPGWEPIILARKPLAGTVATNWGQHGTGALNIEGCRIEASGRPHIESKSEPSLNAFGNGLNGSRAIGLTSAGRWPANVVLDENAARMLDEQSGGLSSNSGEPFTRNTDKHRNAYGKFEGRRAEAGYYGDAGGASRFFYTAKASRSERNAGLEGWDESRVRQSGHADERVWDIPGSHAKRRANHHPTVKPLDLMRWLVRLVTPAGGLILDPFAGSGTTGCAALAEGFRFVGIEREPEYAAIAEARLNATQPGLDFGPSAPPAAQPRGSL